MTVRERLLKDLAELDNEGLYMALECEAAQCFEVCQCEACEKRFGTCCSTDDQGAQPCRLEAAYYMDMETDRPHILRVPAEGATA